MEALIELIEDMSLGFLAKERDEESKPSDYIELEEVEKRIRQKKS
jgi:hypothetical protein